MTELLLSLGAILLGVLLYFTLLQVVPSFKKRTTIYLRVTKDAENIEWILRQFCSGRGGKRGLIVIDEAEGETSLILEKLSRYFGYELLKELPNSISGSAVLTISGGVTVKELKEQLKIIEQREKEQKIRKVG